MPAQYALTRRRPPAVARALQDARVARARDADRSAAARRAISQRRARASARMRAGQSPPLGGEAAQTMLALIGLGAEHVRGLGSWAGDRSAAVRTGAGSAWGTVRTTPVWPSLREAARISLVEAPAWAFQVAVVVMGLPLGAAAGLAAAQAAIGPDPGSATLTAALPALLAILLTMAAVLWALVRLARGGEDQGPVWLLGVAALALTVA